MSENTEHSYPRNTFFPWLPLSTLFWASDLTGCCSSISLAGSSSIICYTLPLLPSDRWPFWATLLFMEHAKALLHLPGIVLPQRAAWLTPLDLLKCPLLSGVFPHYPILKLKALCLIFLYALFFSITLFSI